MPSNDRAQAVEKIGPCGLVDTDQIGQFRDAVRDLFGATDMLVNNAGRAGRGTFDDTSDDAWTEELEEQANRAVTGDYWETGRILAQRRRSDVAMNTERKP